MKQSIVWVGMDVHAADISLAVAKGDGPIKSYGKVPNNWAAVKKFLCQFKAKGTTIRVCYEAGPCGFILHRDLTTKLGVQCLVAAPTLIPQLPGDRVKTDRRDAKKLVEFFRAGQLRPAWVPDEQHEAFRDLIRAREAAIGDQTRARNRLDKFLLRNGRRWQERGRKWRKAHLDWLAKQHFEHQASTETFIDYKREVERAGERISALEAALQRAIAELPERSRALIDALQSLRGVALLSAATIVAEVGDLTRFATAPELMSYAGVVPSEHSSGDRRYRGRITKAGNAHLRRVIGEAAWQYCRRPAIGRDLRRRQLGQSQEVLAISWRAQQRLHHRYVALSLRRKEKCKIAVAVGRELLGFIWAIGRQVELELRQRQAA